VALHMVRCCRALGYSVPMFRSRVERAFLISECGDLSPLWEFRVGTVFGGSVDAQSERAHSNPEAAARVADERGDGMSRGRPSRKP
jgi:hypothetical protein